MSPDALKGAMVATGLFTLLAVLMAVKGKESVPPTHSTPNTYAVVTPLPTPSTSSTSPLKQPKSKRIRKATSVATPTASLLRELPVYDDRGLHPEGLPVYNAR